MEDYKSNSHKAKEERESTEKKVVEKIISGTAKTKKKNELNKLRDAFVSEDAANVKSYIFMDVLIPAAKKAISDIVSNGIDMILYGETGHSKRKSGTRRPYDRYYESSDERRSTRSSTIGTGYEYEDVVLDNRGDAEDVLLEMESILDEYRMVRVSDLYELVGITGKWTDNKYGWTDLRTARVDHVRDGYLIRLPRAKPLD